MNDPLVLTFDIGTQSTRALLVNSRGGIEDVCQEKIRPAVFFQKPGLGGSRSRTFITTAFAARQRSCAKKIRISFKEVLN